MGMGDGCRGEQANSHPWGPLARTRCLSPTECGQAKLSPHNYCISAARTRAGNPAAPRVNATRLHPHTAMAAPHRARLAQPGPARSGIFLLGWLRGRFLPGSPEAPSPSPAAAAAARERVFAAVVTCPRPRAAQSPPAMPSAAHPLPAAPGGGGDAASRPPRPATEPQ
ncbi:trypsin-like [Platysternon megacephalum]|uniref:Trypsin-like n=1 Tax=Platysternon megacephalum TaxID=55544 RepID=A0A4D9DND3_9SAUR|nr:trypsin-like [Platysternon megacephalum]